MLLWEYLCAWPVSCRKFRIDGLWFAFKVAWCLHFPGVGFLLINHNEAPKEYRCCSLGAAGQNQLTQ